MAIKLPKKLNPKTQPDMGFPLISEGKHVVFFKKVEKKPTVDKKGHYILYTGEVIAGDEKKKQFGRIINIDNPNPVAVDMAYNELGTIARAQGKSEIVTEAEQLLKSPMIAEFRHKKNEKSGDTQNDIRFYHPIEGDVIEFVKGVNSGEINLNEDAKDSDTSAEVDDSELEGLLDNSDVEANSETKEVETETVDEDEDETDYESLPDEEEVKKEKTPEVNDEMPWLLDD